MTEQKYSLYLLFSPIYVDAITFSLANQTMTYGFSPSIVPSSFTFLGPEKNKEIPELHTLFLKHVHIKAHSIFETFE